VAARPAPPEAPVLPPIPAAAKPAALTALYSLRTAQGNVFLIDRTLYVGRAPRSPRITSGLEPLLVAVPSPGREVSSTHLEISQEGTTIVVRDLSSNGTIVIPPGHAPTLLSPGQSRVVTLGTRFDIGDQNVLEILPAEAYTRANG
jgi:hypothetical protein